MDRLQKKCAVASVGVHGMLLLILLIGPAFLVKETEPDTLPILDFVPVKTVDALVSGGGNPNAKPPPATFQRPPDRVVKPAPQPEPPKPEVKPEVKPAKTPEPEPVKASPEKPHSAPDSLEVEKKRSLPEVNTKLVVRKSAASEANKKAAEEARKREREAADARRRIAESIGRAANNLSSDLSSSTTIELKGPGGGGVPYANFLQAVKSVYARAWTVPDGVTDDDATTVASVTIARDGTVINYRITRTSGNAEVDRSVQRTLERVKRGPTTG